MQIFINCLCKCPSAARESQNQSFNWGIARSPGADQGLISAFQGKSCKALVRGCLNSSRQLGEIEIQKVFSALFIMATVLPVGTINRKQSEQIALDGVPLSEG